MNEPTPPSHELVDHEEVKRQLLDKLYEDGWRRGEPIPAVEQWCARLGMSPDVLREAVDELIDDDILIQERDRPVAQRKRNDSPRASRILSAERYSDLISFFSPWHPTALRRNWPGMAVAMVIALAASFVSTSYGGPQLLYALFFGLAFHFLAQEPTCRPGIEFSSKTLLRTGVGLLGARITFAQIASLGVAPIVIVICAVALTILFGWLLARRLGRPATEGLLSGGAVAICGASAAMAISAVLPQTKENEKFTLLTVVGVTSLSTLAMVLYPLLVNLLGLNPTAAGVFLGGSIHDVAQVVGAGYLISAHTGDVATFVKLMRVACLVPAVLSFSIVFKSRAGKTEVDTPPMVPFFLIGFVWLMVANSFHLIPDQAGNWISTASRACLVTAIAALGVKTSFQSLASLGWRPVMMLVAETVWLALLVLLSLIMLG